MITFQEILNDAQTPERIAESVMSLDDQCAKVIFWRFGIFGDRKQRCECAKKLKVSIERIRQIELKGLRKLRHPTRLKQILGVDFPDELIRQKSYL